MSKLSEKAFNEFREEVKRIFPNLKTASGFITLGKTPAHCTALGNALYATSWNIISNDDDVWVLGNYTKCTDFTKSIVSDHWHWTTVTYENRDKILDFYRRLVAAALAEPKNNKKLCETLRADIAKMEANLAEMKQKLNDAEHPVIKNVDRISNGVAVISKFGDDFDKLERNLEIIDWFDEDIDNVRDKISLNITAVDAYKKALLKFRRLCNDCLACGLEKFS